jgi:4Fe-4S ferredoxin
VQRSDVRHTEIKGTPWAEEWREAISAIKTGVRKMPDVSGAVSPPDIERLPLPKPEIPKIDPELQKLVDEALLPLLPMLKKPKIRQIMEQETPEQASSKIVERLHKEELKLAPVEKAAVENAAPEKPAAIAAAKATLTDESAEAK